MRAPKVFRVKGQGDTMFVEAPTLAEAKMIFRYHMGDVPESLLTWDGPMPLIEGEEALRRQTTKGS